MSDRQSGNNSFFQKLWEGWRDENQKLNWDEFQWTFREEMIDPKEEWDEQEWILEDPNRFYYPLYGLGDTEASIAIVLIGPAYNANDTWELLTSQPQRELIRGPPILTDVWQCEKINKISVADGEKEIGSNQYHSEFERQKAKWESQRTDGDNGQENTLASELGDLVDELQDVVDDELNMENVFDHSGGLYVTNFMKDGDFDSDILPQHRLPDCLQSDSNRFEKVESDLVSERCDWPGLNIKKVAKNGGFAAQVCQYASREFWLPILGQELSAVNPDVIIPMGKAPTHAIDRLYPHHEVGTPNFSEEIGCPYTTDEGPAIVISSHYAYNRYEAEDVASGVEEVL